MDKIELREQIKTLRQGFKQGISYKLVENKPVFKAPKGEGKTKTPYKPVKTKLGD